MRGGLSLLSTLSDVPGGAGKVMTVFASYEYPPIRIATSLLHHCINANIYPVGFLLE